MVPTETEEGVETQVGQEQSVDVDNGGPAGADNTTVDPPTPPPTDEPTKGPSYGEGYPKPTK